MTGGISLEQRSPTFIKLFGELVSPNQLAKPADSVTEAGSTSVAAQEPSIKPTFAGKDASQLQPPMETSVIAQTRMEPAASSSPGKRPLFSPPASLSLDPTAEQSGKRARVGLEAANASPAPQERVYKLSPAERIMNRERQRRHKQMQEALVNLKSNDRLVAQRAETYIAEVERERAANAAMQAESKQVAVAQRSEEMR